MDREAISSRSWLAGSCCWGEERQDAGYRCLIRTGVVLGAAILNCYHTDGYENSTLQGSADISPFLHPCVLIPIVPEWTRRGYKWHLPLPIIEYWPASAESNIVLFDQSTLSLTGALIHGDSFCCVEAGCSEADSLVSVCVLLCWCLLKRPPQGIISHSWLLCGRVFATLRLQEPLFLLPLKSSLLRNNATGLWETDYEECVNIEIVQFFRYWSWVK